MLEPMTDFTLDYLIDEIDKKYRQNFAKLIIECKLNSHKCQTNCYEFAKDLDKAELCARNCFKPILYTKKNVANIIENLKEDFEKCRVTVRSNYKEPKAINSQLDKCIEKYNKDLESAKEEIEYIYNGYMKNYEELKNNPNINLSI
jgi:hypothetical protein